MSQTHVAMGELAVSTDADDVLMALGLGSCIGLALVDPIRGVSGLAHVVLPESPPTATVATLRFADHAVPALAKQVAAAGARTGGLTAWLVGGASMFGPANGTLDIGNRNAQAVRAQLKTLRIRVAGEETGGGVGRTLRVTDGGRTLTVREAGGRDRPLVAARR